MSVFHIDAGRPIWMKDIEHRYELHIWPSEVDDPKVNVLGDDFPSGLALRRLVFPDPADRRVALLRDAYEWPYGVSKATP